MIRVLPVALFLAVWLAGSAFADYTRGQDHNYFGKTTYTDNDWNVSFYENCELPEYSSTQWIEEEGERFLRFTLKNGQVGGCRSDNRARHQAPWWERAEVKQTNGVEQDRDYSLTYRVRFVKGFDWDREGFLQLHQSNSGCRLRPLILMKFSYGFLVDATEPMFMKEILGRWVDVRLDFNPSKYYDLYIDNKKVADNQSARVPVEACSIPHLKIGVYRPGDDRATGGRVSVMDVDKVRLVDRK